MRSTLLSISLFMMLTFGLTASKGPGISFPVTNHNFGPIKEGEIVSHAFTFTNTGDAPLIITSVEKPCGCTEPVFPKTPIMPGQEGVISVVYYSKGHPGSFRKTLSVSTNASSCSEPILLIKGEVIPKK